MEEDPSRGRDEDVLLFLKIYSLIRCPHMIKSNKNEHRTGDRKREGIW